MQVIEVLIFLVLFSVANLKAQEISNISDIERLKKTVTLIVSKNMVESKIKDSTAVYSFAISILVKIKKKRQSVEVGVNNPEVALFFRGLELLKDINYTNFLNNNHNLKFTVKGYILVHDSKYGPNVIDLSELPNALKYFQIKDENKFVNLGYVIIEYDKKIYN